MVSRELNLAVEGAALDATLSLPSDRARGGIAALHPANDGSRRQLLFEHLAETLPARGIAVLRYDRRPAEGDVPLDVQASDALAALDRLAADLPDAAPVGLWGWSQGAWAAPLAATRSAVVRFLVLCASTGVSPAVQMRYGVVEHIRRAGFPDAADEVLEVRSAWEDGLRGTLDPEDVQATFDRYADRPWFELAWVPRRFDPAMTWTDMDFDPEPVFARVTCPTLLFWGEADEWTPIQESVAAWRRAAEAAANPDVEIVRLPGTDHGPTRRTPDGREVVDPLYERTLVAWLDRVLG